MFFHFTGSDSVNRQQLAFFYSELVRFRKCNAVIRSASVGHRRPA